MLLQNARVRIYVETRKTDSPERNRKEWRLKEGQEEGLTKFSVATRSQDDTLQRAEWMKAMPLCLRGLESKQSVRAQRGKEEKRPPSKYIVCLEEKFKSDMKEGLRQSSAPKHCLLLAPGLILYVWFPAAYMPLARHPGKKSVVRSVGKSTGRFTDPQAPLPKA